MSNEEHLKANEVARRLGVTSGTLKNWRYNGFGPRYIKVGSRVVYPEAYLKAWEARQTRGRE